MSRAAFHARLANGRYRRIAPCALILLVLLTASSPLSAQTPGRPWITGLRLGFDGHFKLGYWTACEITLRGGARQETGVVRVIVPDGDATPSRFTSSRLALPAGQTVRTTLFIKPGRALDEIPVVFESLDDRPVERRIQNWESDPAVRMSGEAPLNRGFIVCVGQSIGLDVDVEDTRRPTVVELADAAQLPTRWQGYEGVDTLVVTTSRPAAVSQLREGSAQLQALEDWIELGGRLLLCVGAEAHAVLDPQHPLARFAPGALDEVVSLRQTAALETYSGTSYRVPLLGKGEAAALQVPRLDNPRGVVELREGDLPLAVRTPRVFGEVTFVGLDLDRRPLANWSGRRAFVDRLLSGKLVAAESDDATTPAAPANSPGYNDLAGQLRGALDNFTGVRIVPFWIVGGLVFVYILIIGPGDFFLVKSVLKRMELTWITFPATVVVVSLAALWLAHWAKGDMLLVNQVDVVDVDTVTGQVRGTTWVNVFSPQTQRYDVQIVPTSAGAVDHANASAADSARGEVLLSWLGLAGSSWGGMNSRAAGPQIFSRPYDFSPALNRLHHVPIDVWSTKGFNARWREVADAGQIAASLTVQADRSLEGSLTSGLDRPLENSFLAFDCWCWPLGELKPSAKAEIKLGTQQDLQAALRDFRLVESDRNRGIVRQPLPYDVQSKDVALVVRTMMFAQAAEAAEYTGLMGRYQTYIDLSPQLKLGRAILVGQSLANESATGLHLNDAAVSGPRDQHWTFHRFLIPVKPARN